MKKTTILIIEDDEDQVRLYKKILQKYSDDCVVKSTSDLGEAKKIFQKDEVSLISLDLSLQKDAEITDDERSSGVEVSGMSFLRELRSSVKGEKANVIVVSGEKQVSNVTKSLQNFKALAYYEKPIDLEVYSYAVHAAILYSSVLELLDEFENSADWDTLELIQKKWEEIKTTAKSALINENNLGGDLDSKILGIQSNFNKQARLPSNSMVEQALRKTVIGKPAWEIIQVYIKNIESFERAQADQVSSLLYFTSKSMKEFREKFNFEDSFIGLYEFTRNYAFVLISERFVSDAQNVDWLIDNLSRHASKLTNKQALEMQGLPLDSLVLPEWEVRVWTSRSDADNFPDLHECISPLSKVMG